MLYDNVLASIGSTPLVHITDISGLEHINLFAKLEFYNPTGSIKDRAAQYVINKMLNIGTINRETVIIESSSGNFGIALSAICKMNGMKFICVIDPNISPINEFLISSFGAKIDKVQEADQNGGYLLTRINKVNELLGNLPGSYWVNQYANVYNAEAYYQTIGNEICNDMEHIDFIFLGVGSGGTITGVSKKIKERYPKAKVIAVDAHGSVIFGNSPQKRLIPGIGSSMVPEILKQALIDDVVWVDELMTVQSCHQLLGDHLIFAGGSSGSVFAAVHKYFKGKTFATKPNVVVVFPDKGDRYASTVYNAEWYERELYFK